MSKPKRKTKGPDVSRESSLFGIIGALSVLTCLAFTLHHYFGSARTTFKIITVSDKFKGTLTADEVGRAIFEGIKEGNKNSRYNFEHINIQISDGGDGYLDSLKHSLKLEIVGHTVVDSLGRNKTANYGINKEDAFAVVEMAQVVGLASLKPHERNPLHTTTYGLGQLIQHVRQAHPDIQRMLLGVGGSSTNDAGLGALQAMGFGFTMKDGSRRADTDIIFGKDVADIVDIHPPEGMDWGNFPLKIDISCDVTNPFIGPRGATRIYGPQKGATPSMVESLEKALVNVNNIIMGKTTLNLAAVDGSGAAGGISGSFHALLGSNLQRGIELVARYANLEKTLENSAENTMVFSGEGEYDLQSRQGKVVSHIENLCNKYNKKFYLVVGRSDMKRDNLFSCIDHYTEEICMSQPFSAIKEMIITHFRNLTT